ncbi:hypothetical protein HanPI659440_Chr05g0205371 [Helianthus annuus]|nr:hypothetical protein HanPI659440_Chr05g0205371 [Helianthus annuus]
MVVQGGFRWCNFKIVLRWVVGWMPWWYINNIEVSDVAWMDLIG